MYSSGIVVQLVILFLQFAVLLVSMECVILQHLTVTVRTTLKALTAVDPVCAAYLSQSVCVICIASTYVFFHISFCSLQSSMCQWSM